MFKRGQFDRFLILFCRRWYLAYGLSLHGLREMMGERGFAGDYTSTGGPFASPLFRSKCHRLTGDPIVRSEYFNSRIEQDPRPIKRRSRQCWAFKCFASADAIQRTRSDPQQMTYVFNPNPAVAEQFTILAAYPRRTDPPMRTSSPFQ
ncbi:hypothetical protein [Mesorhizobium sp. L2C067A000]|uniref:hypothetical protein n=1 Tax=Mesorhizobium sp. L2C067A000 TaxID=1287106 RepID=UPI0009DFA12B|nr:hypothetical protein [Mesorhizobium sp. L2C067A000]